MASRRMRLSLSCVVESLIIESLLDPQCQEINLGTYILGAHRRGTMNSSCLPIRESKPESLWNPHRLVSLWDLMIEHKCSEIVKTLFELNSLHDALASLESNDSRSVVATEHALKE